MADEVELNPGTGGDKISADDLGGGLKVQRVKVQFGPDGTSADVETGNPLPVAPTALAPDAATETTLATRATEATLATRATEATLAARASEATVATLGTEATLATRASETTLATRATETTLQAVGSAVVAVDTTLTDKSQKTQLTDGVEQVGTDANPLRVALPDEALSVELSTVVDEDGESVQPVRDTTVRARLGRIIQLIEMVIQLIITWGNRASQGISSAVVISVASSASNTKVLGACANRQMATFFNDSTATMYLKLGETASTTSYTVQILAGGYYELPRGAKGVYLGPIDALWASANGSVRVTEMS